ncbi:MAG: AraC family transcriptional regulator [Proteobacteria bacterium]|nr:AraC family transcriptional regulator [Pseudomonadota bacterium]
MNGFKWTRLAEWKHVKAAFRPVFICACFLWLGIVLIYPYTRLDVPDQRVDLAGTWKMMFDDRAEFAQSGYDDSHWDLFELPASFLLKATHYGNGYKGVCWFRKTVVIPDGMGKGDLGICLGRIGNADEAFFNGVRIGGLGQFPPDEFSMWNHPRNYLIPSALIRLNQENTIAIRISYFGIAEVLGQMFIAGTKGWAAYSTIITYTQITTYYECMALGSGFLMIFLFFYLKRPEDQEYLFYCLQLCFGAFVLLDASSYWPIMTDNLTRFKLLGISWTGLNVAHPIFLHRIYNLRRKFIERALWINLLIVILMNIWVVDGTILRPCGILMTLMGIGMGGYNLSCHVTALIKKRPYAKTFSFFGIVAILCASHDGFVYMAKFSGYSVHFMGYEPTTMIFHIGAMVFYAGTAMVLVTRFISVGDEVTTLNESLETYILENTLLNDQIIQISKKNDSKSISSTAEEKLKQVINHIHANYLEGLTRDGLADVVGVHPDSLGKQFKTYTGLKLGDYIYQIRIKEAAQRLREEDTNIIDIAFQVGFDSLRTFNRAFLKFMNTTPTNYRKDYRKDNTDD